MAKGFLQEIPFVSSGKIRIHSGRSLIQTAIRLHFAALQVVIASKGGIVIKKVAGGYKVVSEKGNKNLGGPYKTRAEAEKRLKQVEYFKHKG
jgi:hypothetical protein